MNHTKVINNPSLLQWALRSNAVFSLVSAAVLIASPELIGQLMGFEMPWLYQAIGAGLLLFAIQLLILAQLKAIPLLLTRMACYADFSWVVITLILFVVGYSHIPNEGLLLLSIIAGFVVTFGGLQLRGVKLIEGANIR